MHSGKTTLHPGKTTLHPGKTTLRPGKTMLHPGKGTLHPGKTTLHPGKTTLHPGKTTLHPGKTMLHPGKATLHPGKTTLHPGKTTLHPGKATLHPGKTTLHPGKTSLTFYSYITITRHSDKPTSNMTQYGCDYASDDEEVNRLNVEHYEEKNSARFQKVCASAYGKESEEQKGNDSDDTTLGNDSDETTLTGVESDKDERQSVHYDCDGAAGDHELGVYTLVVRGAVADIIPPTWLTISKKSKYMVFTIPETGDRAHCFEKDRKPKFDDKCDYRCTIGARCIYPFTMRIQGDRLHVNMHRKECIFPPFVDALIEEFKKIDPAIEIDSTNFICHSIERVQENGAVVAATRDKQDEADTAAKDQHQPALTVKLNEKPLDVPKLPTTTSMSAAPNTCKVYENAKRCPHGNILHFELLEYCTCDQCKMHLCATKCSRRMFKHHCVNNRHKKCWHPEFVCRKCKGLIPGTLDGINDDIDGGYYCDKCGHSLQFDYLGACQCNTDVEPECEAELELIMFITDAFNEAGVGNDAHARHYVAVDVVKRLTGSDTRHLVLTNPQEESSLNTLEKLLECERRFGIYDQNAPLRDALHNRCSLKGQKDEYAHAIAIALRERNKHDMGKLDTKSPAKETDEKKKAVVVKQEPTSAVAQCCGVTRKANMTVGEQRVAKMRRIERCSETFLSESDMRYINA